MHPLRRLSVAEQVAAHLRAGLLAGRWSGVLPGVARLAAELDVSPATLQVALRQLEAEGLLESRGRGCSRTIQPQGAARGALRVGILLFDAPLDEQPKTSQVLYQIEHDLEAAGHQVFFAKQTQGQMDFDIGRITRHIGDNPADAWIVVSGSRDLLEWFAAQAVPCMALFGRTEGLQLARTGPDMAPAFRVATRHLLELGHRRIVLIVRRARRKPSPGNVEQAFLDELSAHGIKTGDYHLPDWEETPDGYASLLESLFSHTPPTALIIDETPRVIAAMGFLARRHILVPEQVSLVSSDYDASFLWSQPTVAHIRWDSLPIIRRVVRWVAAVKLGRADRRTLNYPPEFVAGGSIGSARSGKAIHPS